MKTQSTPPTIDQLLKHQSFLRSLARSLVTDGGADDLVQDTWLEALRQPPANDKNLRAWIGTIARRLAYRRGSGRRLRVEAVWARQQATVQEAPDALITRERFRRDVSRAVLSMHEPYRSVVLLRFFEGMPPREIALRRGASVNTVNSQLRRASLQLRDKLEGEADDSRAELAVLLFNEAGFARRAPAIATGGTTAAVLLAVFMIVGVAALAWFAFALRSRTNSHETALLGPARLEDPRQDPALEHVAETRSALRVPAVAAPLPESSEPRAVARQFVSVSVRGPDGNPVRDARIMALGLGLTSDPSARKVAHVGVTDAAGLRFVKVHEAMVASDAEDPYMALWAEAPGRVRSKVLFFVAPKSETREIELRIGGAEVRAHGIVLAGAEPVVGARITVGTNGRFEMYGSDRAWTQPSLARSGEDGRFEVEGLADGSYEVLVSASGYAYGRTRLDTDDGEELVCRLSRGAVLTGQVRDAEQNPAAGITIVAQGDFRLPGWSTVTDAQGRFRLDELPAGARRVWAQSAGEALQAGAELEFEAGAEREWNPVLAPDQPLAFRLVDESGRPLAHKGVLLTLQREPGLWCPELTTDEGGWFRVRSFPNEPWFVHVYSSTTTMHNSVAATTATLRIEDPLNSAPELPLPGGEPPHVQLTGRVVLALPLAGVELHLHRSDLPPMRPHPVDRDTGRFDLSVAPGSYRLTLLCGPWGALELEPRELRGGVLDLGVISLPEPVRLEWDPHWPAEAVVEIRAHVPGDRVLVDRWRSTAGPIKELYPARYSVEVWLGGECLERREVTF